jgi:branched-chain amino acid transport system permease protein
MSDILSTMIFLLINGLVIGFIITLVALGLTLIFGVMRIVNMAHGDLYMMGAVISYFVLSFGGNFFISLFTAPILVFAISYLIERFVVRPFEGNPTNTMLVTLGLSFIIQQVTLITYGGVPRVIPEPWTLSFQMFGAQYSGYRLAVAIISATILSGLWSFLHRTTYGTFIRATIQDAEVACATGINTNRIFTFTFALGGMLAALGGVLAAPITQVFYLMGNNVILIAFIIVIVGGLGSFKGTLIIALLLSILEGTLTIFLRPVEVRIISLMVMVLTLLLRPSGLFGRRYR